jgi:hypothetical protein
MFRCALTNERSECNKLSNENHELKLTINEQNNIIQQLVTTIQKHKYIIQYQQTNYIYIYA